MIVLCFVVCVWYFFLSLLVFLFFFLVGWCLSSFKLEEDREMKRLDEDDGDSIRCFGVEGNSRNGFDATKKTFLKYYSSEGC